MSNKVLVAILALIISGTALPAGAAIQAGSVEIRGSVVAAEWGGCGSATLTPQNFAGFFYDLTDNLGTENLAVLSSGGSDCRIIAENALQYNTSGQPKLLNVVKLAYNSNYTEAKNAGLLNFSAGSMSSLAGGYKIEGWQGNKYAGIKNKDYKLARLIVEHGASAADKKTLAENETWSIGGGWSLTVKSINVTATPANVTIFLSKNGVKKNDTLLYEKKIYTYVEKNVSNETNVPMFVTYVDSISPGSPKNFVQLRYTWAISTSVTEIRAGDKFGVFKVVTLYPLTLYNSETTVILAKDGTIDLMGNMKFRVADSNYLRYYPMVMRTAPGTYEVRGSVATGASSWTPQTFSAFFYDLKDNLGTENLSVLATSGSDSRTIAENELQYGTQGQNKELKVVEMAYSNNCTRAVSAGLEQFDAFKMSSTCGNYTIVGWQAEKYVSIKNRSYKLTKLVVEQGASASDKKTLQVGETWDVGGGWTLTVKSIDAKTTPRQVLFNLSKDGAWKDDKVVSAGTPDAKPIYTYVEKSMAGETEVPVFITYVDSIFAGPPDMVQLRYTWAINTSGIEIKAGDTFGVFKVVMQTPLLLSNSAVVTLTKDGVINLMGELKFRVANSSVLRYYPFVTYSIPVPPPPPPPPKPFDTLRFEPKKWNLVSIPKTLENSLVDVAFDNLSHDANNIKWYYNGSAWLHPSSIVPLRGYWVYNNASTVVFQKVTYKNISEPPYVPPSISLKTGWNMIGHSYISPLQVETTLITIDGKYSHLLSYDPEEGWKTYLLDSELQEFSVLEPGKGYWIFMTQSGQYGAVTI